MAIHNQTGQKGEAAAVAYLQQKDYVICETNYRFKRAEIDIIAQKDNILVFVEVKTRSTVAFGLPEDFVSSRKTALFLEAADEYIYQHNWLHDIRFDIIAITKAAGELEIYHIEDAFH